MRFFKYTSLAVLAFAAAACQTDDGGSSITEVPPLAYVRYVNAVPDSLIVTIGSIRDRASTPLDTTDRDTVFVTTNHTTTLRWTDFLEFSPNQWANVGFRGVGQGGYQGVKAGNRTFKIFTFDPTFFVTRERADTSFNFVAGNYYTIVHWRGTGGEQVRIITDETPVRGDTLSFKARMVHVGEGVGAVDAYIVPTIGGARTAMGTGIAELGATAYSTVPLAASRGVEITAAGSATTVSGVLAPAGGTIAGGSTLQFQAGSNQRGSVMTAMAFPGAPAVTAFGRTFRAAVGPGLVWFIDLAPLEIIP